MAKPGEPIQTGVSRQNGSPGAVEVLAIVVNFQTPDLTLDCLRSIATAAPEVVSLRAVVVDNGSGDGSTERISAAIEDEGWESWASLDALSENVGFAQGVNHGYRMGSPSRWLLLLNSDARLHAGTLRYCCKRMEADASIGAFSCLVLNSDGSVQNVARRFPTPFRLCLQALGLPYRLPSLFGWADTEDLSWDRRATRRDVDWLGGAFLFLRGDLIARIGLLDGDFFFFGEDVELCHRVKRAGFRCRYDPGAVVSHIGAASAGEEPSAEAWRRGQFWSARYQVQRKCYGWLPEAVVRFVDLGSAAARAALLPLRYGSADSRTRQAQDLFQLLRSGP